MSVQDRDFYLSDFFYLKLCLLGVLMVCKRADHGICSYVAV